MTPTELRDEFQRRSKEIEELKAAVKVKIERRNALRHRLDRNLASADEQSELGRLVGEIPAAERELGEREEALRIVSHTISERLRIRRETAEEAGRKWRDIYLREKQLEGQLTQADDRAHQLIREIELVTAQLDRAVRERSALHEKLMATRDELANYDDALRARLEEIYPFSE